jgi:predicted nucleic acid-binding Zn ribbon protein
VANTVPNQPHQFSKLAEELIGDLRQVPFEEPRRQVKRPTKPLATFVEELLQKHRIGRDAPEHTIRHHWAEIVGAANAAYSHPVTIERGRLTVLASHAVVRNELFMHRDQLAEKIRQLPGCQDVRNLNIRSG